MTSIFPNLSPLDVVDALSSANAPILLDIRLPEDIAEYPAVIPTAVAVAYDDVDAQAALAHPNGAILVCHKGLKLTAGAKARLINRDYTAQGIAGGQMAWLAAGLPVTIDAPTATIALRLDATAAEVAAAWAALRFTSPRAELLEVPSSDLAGVADKFDAILPTAADAPAFPGLAALLAEVSAPSSLFAAQLIGAGARASAAFACLDAAYRGVLRRQGIARLEVGQ